MSIFEPAVSAISSKRLSMMTLQRLFTIFLFSTFFAFNVQAVRDPDLWWHLRVGEYMLDTGIIPTADPDFAFTTAGKLWFMHEWLAEVIMALVYRAAGLYGLSIFFALIVAATYFLMYLSSPGRPYVAGLVSFVAVFSGFSYTSARPHMFNLLLGAIIVYVVEGIKDKRFSAKWLWLIPPMMIVWVNLHSGFLFGVAILGVYLVGETAAFLFGGDRRALAAADLRMLFVVTAAAGLASLINNNGFQVWLYPFDTLSSEGMRTVIAEWQAPDFHNWYRMLFAFLLVGSLVLMALNRQRPTVTDLLFIVGTGLAGLQSVRHISLFIVLAIPIISRHLLALLTDIGLMKDPDGPSQAVEPIKPLQNTLNWAIALFVIGFTIFFTGQSLNQTEKVIAFYFPTEAVDFIKKEGLSEARVFNDYGWGGYLIWHDIQPFIDGRADLYGDEFLLTFNQVVSLEEGWADILKQYNIDYALLQPDSNLAAVLSVDPSWKLIYTDDVALIFTRADES